MEATLTRQQRLKAIVAGRHDSRGTRFATWQSLKTGFVFIKVAVSRFDFLRSWKRHSWIIMATPKPDTFFTEMTFIFRRRIYEWEFSSRYLSVIMFCRYSTRYSSQTTKSLDRSVIFYKFCSILRRNIILVYHVTKSSCSIDAFFVAFRFLSDQFFHWVVFSKRDVIMNRSIWFIFMVSMVMIADLVSIDCEIVNV
jgi:hypothetical protein